MLLSESAPHSLASHAGKDAEFAEENGVGVCDLAVVDELGVAVAVFSGATRDVQDDVGFVFSTSGVLQGDEKVRRIEVNAELVRPAGAADAQVAHQGFFAKHRFFAGYQVPLLAFVLHGGRDALPNDTTQAHGGFVIEFGFLRLEIPAEFFRKEFLR